MKGRHTAFQRFGSGSHNPFGSVLNKYFLTSDVDRKNNIYEKTDDGKGNQPDLGEEVYGCLAKGISTQGHLEYDYEAMKAKRKTRGDVEQYVLGSEGTILRTWEDKNKKSYEDSSLVPQESIPLNVISKYPIKFSYDEYNEVTDENEVKEVDVPPSAGFSGPFVYRPHKFPSDFTPVVVNKDCIMLADPVVGSGKIYSVPVSSVSIPAGVAHQIINCTKEIKVTGDLDHSVEAKNKKCTGSTKQEVTQTYYVSGGCPGTSPIKKTRTASYECTSSEETTTLQVKGSIGGTMSRYNLLTSLWGEEPVKLDLSPNFYQGSNAKNAYNFSVLEDLYCDCNEESGCPDLLDYNKVKILGDREKVTKLEAGCAVTPTLDVDIIRHDMGENLLRQSVNNSSCVDGGAIVKTFTQLPTDTLGFFGNQRTLLEPKTNNFTSGPVLCARYGAGIAEYVGVEEKESIFNPPACSATELESFRSPKGNPIPTGLTLTMKGNCPNAINENSLNQTSGIIALYDATDRGRAYYQYEEQEGCYGSYPGCCAPCSVYGDQGAYKLRCESEKQCYDNACSNIRDPVECPLVPHPSGSDLSEVTNNCSVPYAHSLMIGRFVQTAPEASYRGLEYVPATEIPFDTGAKYTDNQDLCISFIFNAGGGDGGYYLSLAIPQAQRVIQNAQLQNAQYGIAPIMPTISTCKKWHESEPDISGNKKSVNGVGTLTLKSGDWSTEIPLWTTSFTPEATTCEGTDVKGIVSHEGWIVACERTTQAGCTNDCDCCCGGGCSGCGTATNSEPCNEAKPCEPEICTYSYSSSFTGTEDCPQTANCSGCSDCGQCGTCDCCGCNCDCDAGECSDPCPPFIPIPPTTHSGGGKMGCYGSAREEQVIKTSLNVTLEFLPFTELGGVKQA